MADAIRKSRYALHPARAGAETRYPTDAAAARCARSPLYRARTGRPARDPGTEGDCYLVSPAPAGVWAGKAGRIASWQDAHRGFADPEGLAGVVRFGRQALRSIPAPNGRTSPCPPVATWTRSASARPPDNTNRLAVASPASLFTHAGHRSSDQGEQGGLRRYGLAFVPDELDGLRRNGPCRLYRLLGQGQRRHDLERQAFRLAAERSSHRGRTSRRARAFTAPAPVSTPTAGQQSGFTTPALFTQGGFSLGAAASRRRQSPRRAVRQAYISWP